MKSAHFIALFAIGLFLLGCAAPQPQKEPGDWRSEICGKIHNPDLLGLCEGYVSGGPASCASIADRGMQWECYEIAGIEGKNPQACANVSEINRRTLCIAAVKGDSGVCERENGRGYSRDGCLSRFAAYAKNASMCDGLGEGSTKCYFGVAMTSNDEGVCGMDESISGDLCYFEVARGRGDSSLCGRIGNEAQRQACLAITKQNSSLCPENNGACLGDVAIQGRDWKFCRNFSSEDECYFKIATYGIGGYLE